MKSILYLFISALLVISLSSFAPVSLSGSKIVTLQATERNTEPAALKKSADIISSRLKMYGIRSFEVKVSEGNGQLKVELPDNTDVTEIETLLTSKGDIAFYETFGHSEIKELFRADDKLFGILHQLNDQAPSDPRAGCVEAENYKKADAILHATVPPDNCKFIWGFSSKNSSYCLFALKTVAAGKPTLIRSDVESVNITNSGGTENVKIQIRLKPASASIFADVTRANLNKCLAIVIDDQVYSWPVIKSVIAGGELEVTGDFTVNEMKFFPVIFNTDKLPVSFSIQK